MPARTRSTERRQQILEALAGELESRPGTRITTARLAEVVGVSEAALYRHFPSKARMFEGLFEFAEESVFSRVTKVTAEASGVERKLEQIMTVLLRFSELNPGISRVLLGDALVGEHERLRARSAQFFDRFETALKQVLRTDDATADARAAFSPAVISGLLLSVAEGRLARYSRSAFRRLPTEGWEREWPVLLAAVRLRRQPI